jgi:hypothetical protein
MVGNDLDYWIDFLENLVIMSFITEIDFTKNGGSQLFNKPLFRVILFTVVVILAALGIFFNLKLLVFIDIAIILSLLFILNRQRQ